MQLELKERIARMSVGEFARFLSPEGTGHRDVWRAQVGSRWHSELHRLESERCPGLQTEVAVSGTVHALGWTIELEGRIDQLDSMAQPWVIREIKTVEPLGKASPSAEAGHWLPAWLQAATYARLLNPPCPTDLELLLVEIDTGLIHRFRRSLAESPSLAGHTDAVASLLERRRSARLDLLGPPPPAPYPEWREQQESGFEELRSTLERSERVLFQAPTGFGKTAAAIHAAIHQLRSGRVDRVVYLTAKNSGQPAIAAEVSRQLKAAGAPPDVLLLRSREDHCINTVLHCREEACPHLVDSEKRRPYVLETNAGASPEPSWDLSTALAWGRRHSVCPYLLTRRLLAWHHFWIADVSYLLARTHDAVFSECPGFDRSRTLLIVDEAHNLPSRAVDAHAFQATAHEATTTAGLLDFAPIHAQVRSLWVDWVDWMTGLRRCDALGLAEETALRSLVSRLADCLTLNPPDSLRLGVELAGRLNGMLTLNRLLSESAQPNLIWSPDAGILRVQPLESEPILTASLAGFARVLLQSATLGPEGSLEERCGFSSGSSLRIRARSPWRRDAYRIAVDTRPDTRFAHRRLHLPLTAQTVAELRSASRGAVVVFLPSYGYAEQLCDELHASTPLRAAIQPRGASSAELTDFIERSLVLEDALLLVLGGSLAEGIDDLGGRVTHALVVGPALPEVNAYQEARLSRLGGFGRAAAFRQVYLIPGMTRVNQALGRLVRAPGHQANIVLHCRRFAQNEYASLLDEDFQFFDSLSSTADLRSWLGSPS